MQDHVSDILRLIKQAKHKVYNKRLLTVEGSIHVIFYKSIQPSIRIDRRDEDDDLCIQEEIEIVDKLETEMRHLPVYGLKQNPRIIMKEK